MGLQVKVLAHLLEKVKGLRALGSEDQVRLAQLVDLGQAREVHLHSAMMQKA